MRTISELNKTYDRVLSEAPCGKDLEVGKMKRALGLEVSDKVRDYSGSPADAASTLIDEFGRLEATGMINGAANCSQDRFLIDMMNSIEEV